MRARLLPPASCLRRHISSTGPDFPLIALILRLVAFLEVLLLQHSRCSCTSAAANFVPYPTGREVSTALDTSGGNRLQPRTSAFTNSPTAVSSHDSHLSRRGWHHSRLASGDHDNEGMNVGITHCHPPGYNNPMKH